MLQAARDTRVRRQATCGTSCNPVDALCVQGDRMGIRGGRRLRQGCQGPLVVQPGAPSSRAGGRGGGGRGRCPMHKSPHHSHHWSSGDEPHASAARRACPPHSRHAPNPPHHRPPESASGHPRPSPLGQKNWARSWRSSAKPSTCWLTTRLPQLPSSSERCASPAAPSAR